MGGSVAFFDVTDVVATDKTPKHGTTTTVTVKFKIDEPWATFFGNQNWPYTARVYLEGFASKPEVQWESSGTLTPGGVLIYEQDVTIGPVNLEGVYQVGALVELDNNAGFIMGYYEGDYKISVWTPW